MTSGAEFNIIDNLASTLPCREGEIQSAVSRHPELPPLTFPPQKQEFRRVVVERATKKLSPLESR